MANLKEVRNRIVSVSSTQQITKAMKMVSAAKLKRATDAIIQMRPYSNKLSEILQNLSGTLDTSENVYARQSVVENVLVVLMTSNRGLCGGFNGSIIKKVNSLIANEYAGKHVTVLCVGKKGADFYKRTEHNIHGMDLPQDAELNDLVAAPLYAKTVHVAEAIMKDFRENDFQQVVVVYNQFKNAAVQTVTVEQFLPILPPAPTENKGTTSEYIFEPSKEFIVSELIPKSLKTQLHKAVLDSIASEHGARMTAMHKATDNAGAMIKDLKLTYNKARQAAITKEILEIVGGAEALKN
ncbi:MAG: ATP synthase F1 subunit gamma [Bacteroidia bacterium]